MSWKDDLRPASFRGVSFYVASSQSSAGRKTTVHEFPGKDINYVEDLGRATRGFQIDAFVAGDNYKTQKNLIIEACEREGPGDLVHPYFGDLSVQVNGVISIRESTVNGGMATISISFSESEIPGLPTVTIDTEGNLLDVADIFLSDLRADFTEKFDLFQQAQSVVDNVSGSILNSLNEIDLAFKTIKGVEGFRDLYNNILEDVEDVKLSASNLADNFIGLFTLSTTDESGSFTDNTAITEILALKDFESTSGVIEENQLSFIELIQRSSITGAVQSVAKIEFKSTNQANEIQKLIIPAIDSMMESVSDELYSELHELKAAVLLDIEVRSKDLPNIVDLILPIALPSLVVAYNLYEDIDRSQDIVDRNKIIHPGFIPSGKTLEVLSRE